MDCPIFLMLRIKEWKYTDKGWFCYELCVPEPRRLQRLLTEAVW